VEVIRSIGVLIFVMMNKRENLKLIGGFRSQELGLDCKTATTVVSGKVMRENVISFDV